MTPTLILRRLMALCLVGLSLWVWTQHSEVIELIAKQRPVLFGRYSQGHFGALLLLTPIMWTLAAVFWSRRPFWQAFGNGLVVVITTVLVTIIVTYVAHFFHGQANYVETTVTDANSQSLQLAGAVRQRPPHEHYDLVFRDEPEQARSYPNAPPGYGNVKITLTSDANGFRNPHATNSVAAHYPIIAVGDSFVACSHVSDAQCWTELLSEKIQQPVYNLGVGGSGPVTYLNNFAYFGLPLRPATALFMIYEGNDFKEDVAEPGPAPTLTLGQRIAAHWDFAIQSSPVTIGLRRASHELFEQLGAHRPVPGYLDAIGFMPIKIAYGNSTHYYSFAPKRLQYLNLAANTFAQSREWRFTTETLDKIARISSDNQIQPVFIYAPSTPHVVLPLVKDQLPASQLHTFASYQSPHLPDAETFKRLVFENLDSEENVFLAHCKSRGWRCLSLTQALQAATAAGQQTYYTYDQHWTPEGNQIAAREIEKFLHEIAAP